MSAVEKMKKIKAGRELNPYIPMALDKMGVKNFVYNANEAGVCIKAHISRRDIDACIRIADAMKRTADTGVRFLSRDDIESEKSGVIPETEEGWFERAML